MNEKRVHPYTMFQHIYRFAFLLIFPVLNQLISQPYDILHTVLAMAPSMISVLLLIWWSYQEYRSTTYTLNSSDIHIKRGFILRRIAIIPYCSVNSVVIRHTILKSMFSAGKVSVEVPAKKKKAIDISLVLNRKVISSVERMIISPQDRRYKYKAKAWKVLLMSASWSNPVTGLLISAPAINRMGKILGEELSEKLYSKVDLSERLVAIGIPPLAAGVTYSFVIFFVVATMVQFSRYTNFKVQSTKDHIVISRGLINVSTRTIQQRSINAVSVNQTLLMRILGLYSAYIHTIGDAGESREENLLLAALKWQDIGAKMREMLGIQIAGVTQVKPPSRAIRSFVLVPVWITVIIAVITCTLFVLNGYSRLIILAAGVAAMFLLWWIIFRVKAHRTTGLAIIGDSVIVSGYKGLSLCHAVVHKDKIQGITLSQNPFQKRSSLVNVKVNIFSNDGVSFTGKHLRLHAVKNFVESVEKLQF